MRGFVAIVLHAHLPYVRHPEHERSFEERWLFEALWECYLPLCGVLDRLAKRGVVAPITLSVSPPLAAMLRDDLLRRRFEDHLGRIDRLAARIEVGSGARSDSSGPFGPALSFYRGRLREARALWDRAGGDVLGELVAHHRAGRVELITTTASHAYLPGLVASRASVRAQLRLGLRAFESMTGVRPAGLWLPECAYDPALGADLAGAGARYSVLDAHGIELASPRPPRGVLAPILAPSGVAFFGRDPRAARDVWSRDSGYPGDPAYREFYRDVGFDLPASELEGEVGPGGSRLMTGLKLHRITGPGAHKEVYEPAIASARARAHAADFLARRAAALGEAIEGATTAHLRSNTAGLPPPLLVAPFDAELFGHWWLEGPEFLERVLEGLDTSGRGLGSGSGSEGIGATSLGGYLGRYPEASVAEPAPSSWGEGGFGEAWTGPATASLFRHMHHTSREVQAAVQRWRTGTGTGTGAGTDTGAGADTGTDTGTGTGAGTGADTGTGTDTGADTDTSTGTRSEGHAARALEQSIRELLLLEASDWAFMLARGEMATYAESRVRAHVARARRLAKLAGAATLTPEDAAWMRSVIARDRFLAELEGPAILDAFDEWDARSRDTGTNAEALTRRR